MANRRTCRGASPKSGYYAFDANQNYQYRAFGVPGLGFKRDLAEDLVVAPYASLLALSLRPRQVMENIARLDELQMLGTHGFYESIDFSPSAAAARARRMPSCVRTWRITRA